MILYEKFVYRAREVGKYVRWWTSFEWNPPEWNPDTPSEVIKRGPPAAHDHDFQLGRWERPDTRTDMVAVRCTKCGATMSIMTSVPPSLDPGDEDKFPEKDARRLAYRICTSFGYSCEEATRTILLQDVQGS